jgi:hypothetical protein
MSNTINKTSQVEPTLSDLIPIWQDANSQTRNTSLSMLLALFEDNLTGLKPDTQYAAPNATDFSVTINSEDGSDRYLLLTPIAGYADGTVVLPSVGLKDKQEVIVSCTQAVTALVISSVKTVNGAPTALTANEFFTLKYDLTFDAWYRVG